LARPVHLKQIHTYTVTPVFI